jgi:hypothetical protein
MGRPVKPVKIVRQIVRQTFNAFFVPPPSLRAKTAGGRKRWIQNNLDSE